MKLVAIDLVTALNLGLAQLRRFDATRVQLVAPAFGGGELGRLVDAALIAEALAGRSIPRLLLASRPIGYPASRLHVVRG